MICVRLAIPVIPVITAIPAIPAIPVTFVTLATSEIAVIPAIVVIRETLEISVTLEIIETSESRCQPAARQHGRLPQHSRQAQRDYNRRSLGHSPRCPNRHRRPSLHGALSMLRPASCSR